MNLSSSCKDIQHPVCMADSSICLSLRTLLVVAQNCAINQQSQSYCKFSASPLFCIMDSSWMFNQNVMDSKMTWCGTVLRKNLPKNSSWWLCVMLIFYNLWIMKFVEFFFFHYVNKRTCQWCIIDLIITRTYFCNLILTIFLIFK